MYNLSNLLSGITEGVVEKAGLTEPREIVFPKYGKVIISKVGESSLIRVAIPYLGIEILTHNEELGDFVEVTVRLYGTSPGSNNAIEELVDFVAESKA